MPESIEQAMPDAGDVREARVLFDPADGKRNGETTKRRTHGCVV